MVFELWHSIVRSLRKQNLSKTPIISTAEQPWPASLCSRFWRMMCRKEWEYVWMDTDSSCRTVKNETAAVNCISTPATCSTSCIITNYINLEHEAEVNWNNVQIFSFTFKTEYAINWVNYRTGCKIIFSEQQLLGDIQISYSMNLLRKIVNYNFFLYFQFHQCICVDFLTSQNEK